MSGKVSSRDVPSEADFLWLFSRAAFEAGRYSEAIRFFKDLINERNRISKEQREMYVSACKRLISPSREAFHIINEEIANLDKNNDQEVIERLQGIEKNLKDEISKVCNSLLETVDMTLLPAVSDSQSIVYFNKVKGDCYRYLAEIDPSNSDLSGNAQRARSSYEVAMKSANDDMKMADPVYLGLILNFCVFQYEILQMKDEAIDRADASFNEAVKYLDELDEVEYAEATMILQLIKDNISIWKEERGTETT